MNLKDLKDLIHLESLDRSTVEGLTLDRSTPSL